MFTILDFYLKLNYIYRLYLFAFGIIFYILELFLIWFLGLYFISYRKLTDSLAFRLSLDPKREVRDNLGLSMNPEIA